jgi:arginine decarboxylase
MMLIGAYQEVMGNFHNLFGTTNEAHVIISGDGNYHISRIIQGSNVGEMTTFARYEKDFLTESFRNQLNRQVKKGQLTEDAAQTLTEEYESHFGAYTYLDSNGNGHR